MGEILSDIIMAQQKHDKQTRIDNTKEPDIQ